LVATGWNNYTSIIPVGDFVGAGSTDLLACDKEGKLHLYIGNRHGGFVNEGGHVAGEVINSGWDIYERIIPVGNFNGDGSDDVLGLEPNGNLWLGRGNGHGGFIEGRTLVDEGGWNVLPTVISQW
jgi:hypothetical protein